MTVPKEGSTTICYRPNMNLNSKTNWPTTRRFPRTLDEAFGCDGNWFYPPEDNRGWVDRALRLASYTGWVLVVFYLLKG